MANAEQASIIRTDREGRAWKRWREEHPDDKVDLSGETYVGLGQAASLDLSGADLRRSRFEECRIESVRGADLEDATLLPPEGSGLDAREARLHGTRVVVTGDLDLTGAICHRTDFSGSALDRAWLHRARFRAPRLANLHFARTYEVHADGSDTIVCDGLARYLTWERIRYVGTLPFFGISWVTLALSLSLVHVIAWINRSQWLESLDYPVPVPDRILLLIISSLLLAIGSAIFKLRCPPRVQEISEEHWVSAYNRPRLLYIADKLRRPGSQVACALFMGLGALLGLYLLADRLLFVFRYLLVG